MKTILSTLVGIMLFSATSYASKARLEALGQDANGSIYILDNRSIFLNAASLNDVANGVYTEWGTAGSTPNAEGGFVHTLGNMKFGLHLGGVSASTNKARSDAGDFMSQNNNVDLFLAGEHAVKWGVGFSYSATEKENAGNKAKQNTSSLRLGASQDSWAAHLNLGLSGKAEGTIDSNNVITEDDTFEGKGSYSLGAIYHLSQGSVFLDYSTKKDEWTVGGTDGDSEVKSMSLGWHRGHDMGDNGMWFYAVSYDTQEVVDGAEDSALNATVGFEAQGNSWLTLRGSVAQRVFINNIKDAGSVPNTTKVAAGASLNFGNLSLDGSFSQAGSGQFGTNDVFSNASLSYRF